MNTSAELVVQLESAGWAHIYCPINDDPALLLAEFRILLGEDLADPFTPRFHQKMPYKVTDSADPAYDTEFTYSRTFEKWVCRERNEPTREVSHQVV